MSHSHSQPPGPHGPMLVMQMLQAAQATAVLTAGVELGVFARLEQGPLEPAAVAAGIGCPERTTRILLNALAALGLLSKRGNAYALTPLSEEHLVPGKPLYMGDTAGIMASETMWRGYATLTAAVRAGGSVLDAHAETPENPFWEQFARSSGSMAFPAAAALEGILHEWIGAHSGKVRALDVACGSGIYGFTLARSPKVKLTCLDWPNVLSETREWGTRMGIDPHAVDYLPGNLFEVDYGGPYDLVVLSHVYHHFDPETCQALTRKVAAHLAPGGRVAIQDFLTDADLTNPVGVMFSVTMLAWTRKGEAYAAADYKEWLGAAGFKAPAVHPSGGMPTSWIVAEKA